jgi:IclR family pca regulon transcriptional regulator
MSSITEPAERSIKPGDHLLVLEKGLAVIECFDGRSALSVSEVAELTGLSRAAARRCLLTLTELRYAAFDGRAFKLMPRVLRLGFAYLSNADLPQVIAPELQRVSASLTESCSASVLDGTDVLYIARAATNRIISVDLRVGSRLPAYCNAMGRVLLASLPSAQAEAILRSTDRIKRTPTTITAVTPLMSELRRVREQGYSIVQGEFESGLLTIAVPILDAAHRVVAAANVVVQAERSTPDHLAAAALPVLLALQKAVKPLLRSR